MVHFWCGRCLLLAYWGRGCLLAWILRTGSSLACRPRNLLILQWEAGSWLIWSYKFPWRARPCRGWERSGLSSEFYVKTGLFDESVKIVVEDTDHIKNEPMLLIAADKTTNFFKLVPSTYNDLLEKSITKSYKKALTETTQAIHKENKDIATKLGIDDRVDATADKTHSWHLKITSHNLQTRVCSGNECDRFRLRAPSVSTSSTVTRFHLAQRPLRSIRSISCIFSNPISCRRAFL